MHDEKIEEMIHSLTESYHNLPTISKVSTPDSVNKELIIAVLEKLRQVLYPGYFEENRIQPAYLHFVLGERIEFIHHHLRKQVAKALETDENFKDCSDSIRLEKADALVLSFLKELSGLREVLATDVEAAYKGDPAAYNTDEIIMSYPGLFAVTVYRIAHALFELGIPMIPRMMTEYAHSLTGIDIHPGAQIGRHFFIDHGTGIVIGETTKIGEHVKIYQGVTLGALSTRKGQELKNVKRHPTIGNHVTIYSGTTILGGDTVIGDHATIGGNAFIVSSVDEGVKVSVKSPELLIRSGKPSELKQTEFWDWVI